MSIFVRVTVDLVFWLLALFLGIAVEGYVLIRVLGMPVSEIQFAGDPRMWIAQFIQPLITLPLLTLVLRWHGEDWSKLGLHKPRDRQRFVRHVAYGMLALVTLAYVIQFGMVAMDIHESGTSPLSSIQGNVPALLAALAHVIAGVGFNEELQMRGFIQSRVAAVLGGGKSAWLVAAVFTGLIFGLLHTSLGPANVVYAGLGGVMLGIIYLWADRNLWVVIILHSLFDVMRLMHFFWMGHDLPVG